MKPQELEVRLPEENLWGEDTEELYRLLNLKGKDRLFHHRHICIEVLHHVGTDKPTKANLQRLCRIRKKTFLPLLKYLIAGGIVTRSGDGTKGSPYRYSLSELHLRKP